MNTNRQIVPGITVDPKGHAIIDTDLFYLNQMPELLGVLQHIIDLGKV